MFSLSSFFSSRATNQLRQRAASAEATRLRTLQAAAEAQAAQESAAAEAAATEAAYRAGAVGLFILLGVGILMVLFIINSGPLMILGGAAWIWAYGNSEDPIAEMAMLGIWGGGVGEEVVIKDEVLGE